MNGEQANCDGNNPYGTETKGPDKGLTTPVGSYRANAFGLYDMHGNVCEWCADWYGSYEAGTVSDPSGPLAGLARVHRGGSWYDAARRCRSACRYRYETASRSSHLGFRVALNPSGK
ncbi:MAG: formylglycine-generating enzyme family protein [Planctomycetota bacterium]|nr:formylglycine-generating enzyme family protein [Planctomycetota bacterium]